MANCDPTLCLRCTNFPCQYNANKANPRLNSNLNLKQNTSQSVPFSQSSQLMGTEYSNIETVSNFDLNPIINNQDTSTNIIITRLEKSNSELNDKFGQMLELLGELQNSQVGQAESIKTIFDNVINSTIIGDSSISNVEIGSTIDVKNDELVATEAYNLSLYDNADGVETTKILVEKKGLFGRKKLVLEDRPIPTDIIDVTDITDGNGLIVSE